MKSTEGHRQGFSKESNPKSNRFKWELEIPGRRLNSLCKGCSEAGKKGDFVLSGVNLHQQMIWLFVCYPHFNKGKTEAQRN